MAGVVADMNNSKNNTGVAAGDTYKNIENLVGSSWNDALTGNKLANVIQGGARRDMLSGSGGFDTLFGQFGNGVFKFVTAKDGADTIGDFTAGQDAVGIVKSGFKINASVALGPVMPSTSRSITSSAGPATPRSPRKIRPVCWPLNPATGNFCSIRQWTGSIGTGTAPEKRPPF
jgi:hypothetical protein